MSQSLFPSLLCSTEQVTEEQLATEVNLVSLGNSIRAVNRRSFLRSIAAASTAAAAGGLLALSPRAEAQSTAPSIVDVLNFALNLEYLEANLYAAVSGMTPPTGGGPVTGAPTQLSLDTQTMSTATGLYMDEMAHISTLQSAIKAMGGTSITQPAIDLSSGGKMVITTQAQFLTVARQFTAVGNSAYAGSAQFLVSNVSVLTTASQILGAEAQHLGAVNYLCCLQNVMSPAVDALDYPPIPPNTFFTISPIPAGADGPALGPVRDTTQVLGIVYGISDASTTNPPVGVVKGGFFPNGVNGTIIST